MVDVSFQIYKGIAVHIRHTIPIPVLLHVRKQRKPFAQPHTIFCLQHTRVGQCVVVQKETGGDDKGNDHIDAVVLVCRQNKENAKYIQHPREHVERAKALGCVCKDQKRSKVGEWTNVASINKSKV